MTEIKLTEEHKSKLLEMCNKLFPEYDFTLDKWKQCFVTLGLKSKVAYDSHIHWFEFCMTHLYTKLIVDKYNYYSISDAMSNGYTMIYDQHPIDYLYDEFKN
jgi:hypothetical protein